MKTFLKMVGGCFKMINKSLEIVYVSFLATKLLRWITLLNGAWLDLTTCDFFLLVYITTVYRIYNTPPANIFELRLKIDAEFQLLKNSPNKIRRAVRDWKNALLFVLNVAMSCRRSPCLKSFIIVFYFYFVTSWSCFKKYLLTVLKVCN